MGRHGFGEIHFEQPVDLSALSSLDELLGKVVRFRKAACDIYPEGYQRPPPGEGLNVPATVHLLGCWPEDGDTNTYDEQLRQRQDAQFVRYDSESGECVFKVSHFSSSLAFGD